MFKGNVPVVDDDPALSTLLKEALEDQGYRVYPAVDAAAPQVARKMQPDVNLPDDAMPGMEGAPISRQRRGGPTQLLHIGRVRVRRLPGGGRECLAYCRSCAWRTEGWPEWQRVGWLRAWWLRLRCDACGRALYAQP